MTCISDACGIIDLFSMLGTVYSTACLWVSHYNITITRGPAVSIYLSAAQPRCHLVEGCSHHFRSMRSHRSAVIVEQMWQVLSSN
jgi:hypothetical protein